MKSIIVLLAIHLTAHFVPFQVTDFVADDWGFFGKSIHYSSYIDLMQSSMRDADRPLYAFVSLSMYRMIGDNPLLFSLYGLFITSMNLIIIFYLAKMLFSEETRAFCVGIVFVLLFNLTESYQWPTVVSYGHAHAAFVSCAIFYYKFKRSGRNVFYLCSLLCYAIGIGTYEIGLALPASFLAFETKLICKKTLLHFSGFALIFVFYSTWRFTNVFGFGIDVLSRSNLGSVDLSFGQLRYNLIEAGRWWIGSHAIEAFLNGLSGFTVYAPALQRRILLLNFLVMLSAGFFVTRGLQKTHRDEDGLEVWRVVLFAFLWFIATMAPCVLNYTASRALYVPAVGFSFLLSTLLFCWLKYTGFKVLCVILGVICLCVHQGTALQWHESGKAARNLYETFYELSLHENQRSIILLDTRLLRHRLSGRLLGEVGAHQSEWSQYGNAQLIRGFVPSSMSRIIWPEIARPKTIMDVEHNLSWTGETAVWYGRFSSEPRYEADWNDVWIVDVWKAINGKNSLKIE